MDTLRCFRCGELDHVRADCPQRTPAATTPAAPPDGGGQGSEVKFVTDEGGHRRLVMDIPGWTQGPIADPAEWMAQIRANNPQLEWNSAEAREQRMRALAREQLEELRQERLENLGQERGAA